MRFSVHNTIFWVFFCSILYVRPAHELDVEARLVNERWVQRCDKLLIVDAVLKIGFLVESLFAVKIHF
jgi:hypothetical protein